LALSMAALRRDVSSVVILIWDWVSARMASLCWFCGATVWVGGAVKVEMVVSLVPFFVVYFGGEYSAQKVAEAVFDLSSSTGSRPLA